VGGKVQENENAPKLMGVGTLEKRKEGWEKTIRQKKKIAGVGQNPQGGCTKGRAQHVTQKRAIADRKKKKKNGEKRKKMSKKTEQTGWSVPHVKPVPATGP